MLKLNLGCGATKLPGYVNIDVEVSCKPDLILNFITHPLPYEDNTVDQVVLFHTIEHISKQFHAVILKGIYRVLKPGGLFYISYPEFTKCYENWRTNYKGLKQFWEATLYGRQLYPSDFHVCIMDTSDFKYVLKEAGFKDIVAKPEPTENYNTMLKCCKGVAYTQYEDAIKKDTESFTITVDTTSDKKRSKGHNSTKSR